MNTPETHTRYRVQRLIRMGEWLERHEALLIALYDAIDEAHTESLEMEMEDTLILEYLQGKQMDPLRGLGSVIADLRGQPNWGVKRGEDVTLLAGQSHHQAVIPQHVAATCLAQSVQRCAAELVNVAVQGAGRVGRPVGLQVGCGLPVLGSVVRLRPGKPIDD